MKRIIGFFFSFFLVSSLWAQEGNLLLDASFWEGNPDVSAVSKALKDGASPTEMNAMAFDPLTMAILHGGSEDAIRLLLDQKGINVNRGTHDGRSYLFWAAVKDNVPVVNLLIKKGADPNKVDDHGMTPLSFMAAAGQKDLAVYKALCDGGADLHRKYQNGADLLLLEIGNDTNLSVTDYLLSKGFSLDVRDSLGNTAFDYAAQSGNLELMKKLLSRGVKYTDNALIMASEGTRRSSNKLEVYQYLLGLPINPSVTGRDGENVLHNIVQKYGQDDIIKFFISLGVNVNQVDKEGNTPFLNACSTARDTSTIALLLPLVSDVNQVNAKGATGLDLAVAQGSSAVVSFLIKNGADVHHLDSDGNGLGYYLIASASSRARMAFGGRPGGMTMTPPAAGGRPVNFSQQRNHEGGRQDNDWMNKLNILKSHGVDFTATQAGGNTLYHLAVLKNDMALLKQLENLSIDINLKNKDGLTALHEAAMVAKDDTILKYLLSLGARKDLLTDMGESVYDLAKENEYLSQHHISIDFLK